MTENKYGNLLDKFMNVGNPKDYNGMLDREKQKYEKAAENRYGNLLKNAKPDMNCLNAMVSLENERNGRRIKEAEEERQSNIERQKRIEREKQEHESRVARNSAFVNGFLERKRKEQEMKDKEIQERKKKEAEEQKLYSNIDRLMNIGPKLADAYVKTMKEGNVI